MALPSGYSKIDYIEATGTQYFDTGVKPNQNTRVVMDIEVLTTTQCAPFGARESKDSTTFTLFLLNATSGRTDYGTSKQSMTFDSVFGRYMIDANKNTTTVNGVAITHTAATFSVDYNLFLLAVNTAGTASNFAKAKLYSCKIYNIASIDRIIRNFIPCKSDSGEIGLWDDVGGKFYANAGTGTFTTGSKHKTRIDGTSYEIKSGRVLIGGTGYDIKKGRTLIDGTGYDISFGTPVGELEEGALVKINENGSPVEFYVAKHDYESSLNGSGRTLVVRKDCHSKRPYSSRTGCTFPDSILYTWLNNTYITYLDDFIRSAIDTTKFTYTSDYVKYTYATGNCAVFLLGVAEINPTNNINNSYEDGTPLPIADTLKIAYYDGSPVKQWTRAWVHSNGTAIACIDTSGILTSFTVLNNASATNGVRPIFTLPSDMSVDSDFNIIPT